MNPPDSMHDRIIAIGDIHGCAFALEALIECIKPRPNDVLIPLGDYIDRGTHSPRVLDLMIDLNIEPVYRDCAIEREAV